MQQDIDVFGPITLARRCLDTWLAEESRSMNERQRRRVAALIARYFHYEDEVNEQLILSFLRHYSGGNVAEMDDPSQVRMEIKTMLDQAGYADMPMAASRRPLYAMALSVAVLSVVLVFVMAQWTVTPVQQQLLRRHVEQIVTRYPDVTTVRVWNDIKKSRNVRRYQDLSYWQYYFIRRELARKYPAR